MPENPAIKPQSENAKEGRLGLLYGLAAYGWWGLVPIYFKAVGDVPAVEVLGHRVVWSVLLLSLLMFQSRQWAMITGALADGRTRLLLLGSTSLIACNWLVYIYSVTSGQILQSSLGYYINPLVNITLGYVFLGERLRPRQKVSMVLAAIGVAFLATYRVEGFPWIALTLAFSFAFYGLLRKTMSVGSLPGLTIEVTLLLPLAIAYLTWIGATGAGSFGTGTRVSVLLFLAGAVTSIPLLWFAAAARRLPLSTMGFLQYIAPSGQFLLAVFAYGEKLTVPSMITFALIWTALGIFSYDAWQASRSRRRIERNQVKFDSPATIVPPAVETCDAQR